jgi:hypothetical protein
MTTNMDTLPFDDVLEHFCMAARCPVENMVELGGDVRPQGAYGLTVSREICYRWARCAAEKKGNMEIFKVLLELRDDMRAQGAAGGLFTPLH